MGETFHPGRLIRKRQTVAFCPIERGLHHRFDCRIGHTSCAGYNDGMHLNEPVLAPGDRPAIAGGQNPLLLRRLLRAKDRMDASSHEDWPIRRLAGVSGVSEAHFARSFRQAFGMPPHRYLLTRRIARAKTLLRDTDLAVTAIAFETGWSSLGTFGRTFGDVTGESPGAFRIRERGVAQKPGLVPACHLSAALRPDLTIAVSEKRGQDRDDRLAGTQAREIP